MEKIIHCNENGGIVAYKDNGSRAFVQVYTENEVSVKLKENNIEKTEYIRVRIGINEGNQILILNNGKIYIVNGYTSTITSKNELSIDIINNLINIELAIKDSIGNLLSLKTNKKTIVGSINELYDKFSTSRILQGNIPYIRDNIDLIDVNDLSICYNTKSQRFEYYSTELKEWTILPIGWQKLNKIVRTKNNLPTKPIDGLTIGVLYDEIIYQYINNTWTQISISDDKPGDEYLVRHVYNNEYNGNITGSVIYTLSGWTYLINYENI